MNASFLLGKLTKLASSREELESIYKSMPLQSPTGSISDYIWATAPALFKSMRRSTPSFLAATVLSNLAGATPTVVGDVWKTREALDTQPLEYDRVNKDSMPKTYIERLNWSPSSFGLAFQELLPYAVIGTDIASQLAKKLNTKSPAVWPATLALYGISGATGALSQFAKNPATATSEAEKRFQSGADVLYEKYKDRPYLYPLLFPAYAAKNLPEGILSLDEWIGKGLGDLYSKWRGWKK